MGLARCEYPVNGKHVRTHQCVVVLVQAQRAGNLPADTATLFPNVAEWKEPGYTNACQEYLTKVLEPEDAADVNLEDYLGYFEAGSTFCSSLHRYNTLIACLGRGLPSIPCTEPHFPPG